MNCKGWNGGAGTKSLPPLVYPVGLVCACPMAFTRAGPWASDALLLSCHTEFPLLAGAGLCSSVTLSETSSATSPTKKWCSFHSPRVQPALHLFPVLFVFISCFIFIYSFITRRMFSECGTKIPNLAVTNAQKRNSCGREIQ